MLIFHGFHKQVRLLVHIKTNTDEEIETILNRLHVAPDRSSAIHVNTNGSMDCYSNRLTPIVGDGFRVAGRSIVQWWVSRRKMITLVIDHARRTLYSGDYVLRMGHVAIRFPKQPNNLNNSFQLSTTENQPSVAETNSPNTAQNPTAPNTNQDKTLNKLKFSRTIIILKDLGKSS